LWYLLILIFLHFPTFWFINCMTRYRILLVLISMKKLTFVVAVLERV
jgi:hypothetical protein